MKVAVIDGQGGRLGQTVIEKICEKNIPCELTAVGTNSAATTAMLRAGAKQGATGENPVIVAARTADVIVCPIGLLAADALLGEVTEKMAAAIGRSKATKLLIPVNMCENVVVGTQSLSMVQLIDEAVAMLERIVRNGSVPR